MPDNLVQNVLFEGRAVPDGVYDTCFNDFSESSDSLSQLDIGEDFLHETEDWPPSRLATRFFRPGKPDVDITVAIFGEVLDEADGHWGQGPIYPGCAL